MSFIAGPSCLVVMCGGGGLLSYSPLTSVQWEFARTTINDVAPLLRNLVKKFSRQIMEIAVEGEPIWKS